MSNQSQKGFSAVILLLIVILLAGGGYAYYNYIQGRLPFINRPEVAKEEVVATQSEIFIEDLGFTPSTIQIKKGSQVTWTNKSQAPHWIASDPHPSHDGLPGLDSTSAIAQNDSYSYTFEKSGTFTYHDHLNPLKFKGTIIVIE